MSISATNYIFVFVLLASTALCRSKTYPNPPRTLNEDLDHDDDHHDEAKHDEHEKSSGDQLTDLQVWIYGILTGIGLGIFGILISIFFCWLHV